MLKPKTKNRNSQIQKSSSSNTRFKIKNPVTDSKSKLSRYSNKPPLSISTTPSNAKGSFKPSNLKQQTSLSTRNGQVPDRLSGSIAKPPTASSITKGVYRDRDNEYNEYNEHNEHKEHSEHKEHQLSRSSVPTSQPKQKYMSFIKKTNLEIEIPDDKEGIPPAPVSTTHRVEKERSLQVSQTQKKKPMTTKNTQRVTFDFDDPSEYPLQPAGRIVIPNHESTK